MAVPESLEKLVEDGVIDEIQQRLMSGKEASVYVVSRRGEIIAAKVYKARDRRTFKSTSSYTEGRNQTRNTRDKRAMDRRSSYGKELMEDSWRDMEYRALFDAHHAGVRVPKPIMIYEDVLLMELLVDENDAPAPRLADFDLSADEAVAMLKEVYRQVRLLLGTGRIHGDLSAFNILMAAGGPTIIDLPQVVDAAGNNQAREILKRDLRNVVEHLARFDERLLRFVDCGEVLFQHYQRGTLDEATEPREVRREFGGGRRMRGEERADGSAGAPRRGPPQHGRGPQQGGGYRGGPPQPQGQGPRQDRGPRQDQGFGQHRGGPQGPQQGRGPRQDMRGPQQDRGPRQDMRGPQQDRAPQQDRGPRPDMRGPQQDRGAHPDRGPHQDRGPRQDRGPHQDRGPRQDRGPQQDRGPRPDRPQHDGRPPQFDGRIPPQDRGPNRFDAPRDRGPRPNDGPPRPNDNRSYAQGDGRGGPNRGPSRSGPPSNGARDSRDRPPVEVDVIRRRTGPKPG